MRLRRVAILFAGVVGLSGAALKIPGSAQPTWTLAVGVGSKAAPRVQGGRLVFIAHNDFRNQVYSVEARTGAVVWKSALRAMRMDVFADETVRLFTLDRYYVGLDASTGREFDRNDILKQPGILVSGFHPLYVDGLTIVMGGSGELTALSAKGAGWHVRPGWAAIDSTGPVAYKGLVLIGGKG